MNAYDYGYGFGMAFDAEMYRGHQITQLSGGGFQAAYPAHGVRITASSLEELKKKVDQDLTAYGRMNNRGGYIMDAKVGH